MRLRTDIFVAALTRRVFAAGGFAAVMRKGAAEAGAVFVVLRARDGGTALLAPAPQTDYGEERPGERRFVRLPDPEVETALADRLAREARFDPDIWIVELETGLPVEELVPLTTP